MPPYGHVLVGDFPKYDTRADDLEIVLPVAATDSLANRLAPIAGSALSGPGLLIPERCV